MELLLRAYSTQLPVADLTRVVKTLKWHCTCWTKGALIEEAT